MRSTMMLAVLLLPVALASDRNCTCPSSPTPEDSPVCGSDGRTYSSECELQCAGLPGLSATHLGPCNTTVVASRRRRSTVELEEWSKCQADRKCAAKNCEECIVGGFTDSKCRQMCRENCICGCAGLPTGGLDEDSHDRWYKCFQERECGSKKIQCYNNCDNQVCRHLCAMDYIRCNCGCIQHAPDTSTPAAPTTSTTTAPTTSTTTAPTSTTEASATDTDWTWQKYTVCVDQSCNCGRSSAPELQGIRKANCTCSCMGLPGGDLEAYDSEAVQRCLGDCGDQEIKCDQACRGQKECLDSCSLRKHQCRCECNSTKGH